MALIGDNPTSNDRGDEACEKTVCDSMQWTVALHMQNFPGIMTVGFLSVSPEAK